MALVEFKNVEKYYGDYHALRNINLRFEKRTSCCPAWTFWLWEVHSYPYDQWFGGCRQGKPSSQWPPSCWCQPERFGTSSQGSRHGFPAF